MDPVTCFKNVSFPVSKWDLFSLQPGASRFIGAENLGCRRLGGPGCLCVPLVVYLTVPRLETALSPNSSCLKMGSLRGSSGAPTTTRKGLITLFNSPVIAAFRVTRRACPQTGPAFPFHPALAVASFLLPLPFFQALWLPCLLTCRVPLQDAEETFILSLRAGGLRWEVELFRLS